MTTLPWARWRKLYRGWTGTFGFLWIMDTAWERRPQLLPVDARYYQKTVKVASGRRSDSSQSDWNWSNLQTNSNALLE